MQLEAKGDGECRVKYDVFHNPVAPLVPRPGENRTQPLSLQPPGCYFVQSQSKIFFNKVQPGPEPYTVNQSVSV